jgi:DNA (cytosine-5)-methyltransferase 1
MMGGVSRGNHDSQIPSHPLPRCVRIAPMMNANAATVLDLFCGAGGLSLGFKWAGFKLVLAVDNDKAALETYSANLGAHAKNLDLSHPEISLPATTVIIGGPPCQGFSSAGARRTGDLRNSLVACYANIVARLRPRAFVFENVEGFLTAERGERVLDLLSPLLHAGYRIHLRKVNAANYGVPQHRKRVIAIGALRFDPGFPDPTHTAFGAPGALLASKHQPLTPTIMEAIADLPSPSTCLPGAPQGHFYRQLEGADLERALALEPGMTMRDLPVSLHHASYQRRAFRRVMDGTPTERRGGAPAGIRRLRPDEPSKAITSGARSEFVHPFEHRPLTIRECARLQTFPDTFEFRGTQAEQGELIGNAVPPLLANNIAISLAEALGSPEGSQCEGAILSFQPTLSDGCSPALRQMTNQVLGRFRKYVVTPKLSLWTGADSI